MGLQVSPARSAGNRSTPEISETDRSSARHRSAAATDDPAFGKGFPQSSTRNPAPVSGNLRKQPQPATPCPPPLLERISVGSLPAGATPAEMRSHERNVTHT